MGDTVAILGGGVGGLSAAHELVERGFDVTVCEARDLPGGKARSLPVPGSGADGRSDLPGDAATGEASGGEVRHVPPHGAAGDVGGRVGAQARCPLGKADDVGPVGSDRAG